MDSFKQLPDTLKIKLNQAHNAAESFQKTAVFSGISPVCKVIKKCQLKETVRVTLGFGIPRTLQEKFL